MFKKLATVETNLKDRSFVPDANFINKVFISPSAKSKLQTRKQLPLAVFPRHLTNSKQYFNFQRKLVEYYQDNVGEGTTDGGFIKVGRSTSPLPLLTTMPYHAKFSFSPVSNRLMADEKNLVDGFESSEHRQIFDDLMDLLHSKYVDISVKVNKSSASGPPTYSKDVKLKIEGMEYFVLHFKDIMKFIHAGDLEGLYDKHGFLFFSTVGSRLQQDGGKMVDGKFVGKPRPYYSREYAMSGGTKGEVTFVEKDLAYNDAFRFDDGSVIKPGLRSSARTRLVYGYQTPIVQIINQLVTPQVEANHKTYESTYKTRGPLELEKWCEGAHSILGLDVSNHDTLIRNSYLMAYVERLPLKEDIKVIITMLLRAPYFRPPLNDGEEPVFSANPFDINSFDHELGLPSGAGLHSAFGKAFMTFTYIIMITDFTGYKGKEWLDMFLKGFDPDVKLKDSVDDALYNFKRASELEDYLHTLLRNKDISKFKDSFKGTDAAKRRVFDDKQPSPYHVVEAEDGVVYLGTQISESEISGQRFYHPSLVNYSKNWYMPENGVHTSDYWFIGFQQRKEIFATAPGGTTLIQDVDNIFAKTMGEHPDDIIKYFIQNNRKEIDRLLNQDLSPIEIEVMMDPSKLLWKHTDGYGVREEIEELFVSKVPENLRYAIFKMGFSDEIKEYNEYN